MTSETHHFPSSLAFSAPTTVTVLLTWLYSSDSLSRREYTRVTWHGYRRFIGMAIGHRTRIVILCVVVGSDRHKCMSVTSFEYRPRAARPWRGAVGQGVRWAPRSAWSAPLLPPLAEIDACTAATKFAYHVNASLQEEVTSSWRHAI